MAKQKGIIPLKGTIGNISFYRSADGFLAREKGSLDGNRIANDPAFQRTRENGAEFRRAAAAGKLLRDSLRSLIQNANDRLLTSRLVREIMKVIKADLTSDRGFRNVIDGEAELLMGFEFNEEGKLSTGLYAPYTATIDRATGLLQVSIPSFTPMQMITAPAGATHFKINAAGAEIDFENKIYVADVKSNPPLPWNNTATAAITLDCQVTANSTHPLFLVLGLEFFQQVNGNFYPLKTGAFNALAIVKVSGV